MVENLQMVEEIILTPFDSTGLSTMDESIWQRNVIPRSEFQKSSEFAREKTIKY